MDSSGSRERIEFLDSARGLTVLLMIFANTVSPFTIIPAWSKHAEGFGFTYVDAIAPTFMFIMGLSLDISFARRVKQGMGPTIGHFLKRYGLLFLFGSIGTVLIYFLEDGAIEWIIFQNLAIAGLVVLPFMFIDSGRIRTVLAFALMLVYEVLETWVIVPKLGAGAGDATFGREVALLLSQSLGLATLALFGAGISKRIQEGRVLSSALPWGLALIACGLALWPIMPPYRGLANLSYLLLGLGWGNLTVTLLYLVHRAGVVNIPVLSALGKNSLLMFMVASVLYKCLYIFIPPDAGVLAVGLGAFAVEFLCIALAELLKKRKIFIKL
jgi:predicted acyltransferase